MGGGRRGEGRTANGETRTDYCRCGGGSSYRSSVSCGGHCLSETLKGAACPLLIGRPGSSTADRRRLRCRCRSRARASLRNRHQRPSIMGFEDEVGQSRPVR